MRLLHRAGVLRRRALTGVAANPAGQATQGKGEAQAAQAGGSARGHGRYDRDKADHRLWRAPRDCEEADGGCAAQDRAGEACRSRRLVRAGGGTVQNVQRCVKRAGCSDQKAGGALPSSDAHEGGGRQAQGGAHLHQPGPACNERQGRRGGTQPLFISRAGAGRPEGNGPGGTRRNPPVQGAGRGRHGSQDEGQTVGAPAGGRAAGDHGQRA